MKLRTRISITALATAAAAGTSAAVLATAAGASTSATALVPGVSAHPVSQTLTFTSVEEGQTSFSKTLSVAQDKDVNTAGKIIGYDVIRFVYNPRANTGTISAVVNLQGGFLYGQLHQTDSPVSHGTVTGGTGAFKGATGTITARALDQQDDRTAITITYHQ
jgi:hypothetical protein